MNPLDPAKSLISDDSEDEEYSGNNVFEILKDAHLGLHYSTAEEAALLGMPAGNYDLEDMQSQKSSRMPGRCERMMSRIVRFLVEDWMFLALLGISTAICSLTMEFAIEHLQTWHISTYRWASELESEADHFYFTYLVWMLYAVVLVTSSALFAHYVAPQAIGSGIPEMKTIMRGVILKEYLTVRTLLSKMVGLTLSLGSGLPIGKEGPFVHVASVVANQLSRFVGGIRGAYANESRSTEMLAAGCAVGVACTFSAPIGGVLFSIEVTSVYFAVRNYWRGFFAALCSATTFRICRLWLTPSEVTVIAYYQTRFPKEAFFPEELPIFAMIGLVCGFGGALYIKSQRTLVLFLRRSTIAKRIIQKNWILYPILVAFLVSSLTYPKGFGQFLSGEKLDPLAMAPKVDSDWQREQGELLFMGDGIFLTKAPYPVTTTYNKTCQDYDIKDVLRVADDQGIATPAILVLNGNQYALDKQNWPLPSHRVCCHPVTKFDLKRTDFVKMVWEMKASLASLQAKRAKHDIDGVIVVCSRARGGFARLILSILMKNRSKIDSILTVELSPEYRRVLQRVVSATSVFSLPREPIRLPSPMRNRRPSPIAKKTTVSPKPTVPLQPTDTHRQPSPTPVAHRQPSPTPVVREPAVADRQLSPTPVVREPAVADPHVMQLGDNLIFLYSLFLAISISLSLSIIRIFFL